MKFYLKAKCPVCERENTTDHVCFVSNPGETRISAEFECIGGCGAEYTINATGKTANLLMNRMDMTMED